MTALQAYRFALDPTPRQQRLLASHVGARRFAFNWGLALVKERLDARDRGETVTVPWSMRDLRDEWNCRKGEVAPWWRENSKEAYASGFDGLAQALKAFFASRRGKRKGAKVAFPRFKKRGRGRQSVRLTTGAIRVEDRMHVTLPRIGRVKSHEETLALLRRIQGGTARILSATVSLEGGRWQVSFTCEVQREAAVHHRPGSAVGVDAGIRHLAVLSTGEKIESPRALKAAQVTLARLNRQLARRTIHSSGWYEAQAKLYRAHARVAHIRRDAMHKLTTRLAKSHGTVVVEHLNVSGMLQNHHVAQAMADAGIGELRRQLSYKCAWYGTRLVEADRFYPSSKTCCRCGAVKAKLPLSERVFRCEQCGFECERDENAARNLAALASTVAGSGPETENARGGGGAWAPPVKREAGKQDAGKAGTACPRGQATRNRRLCFT